MVAENNNRIVNNTLFLYFRMILTMLVSLFTVRIVFNSLGEIDYGINNVVGGVVLMFSFLSGTMASASQRFFAFELEKADNNKLKKTFSLTMFIYSGIGIIVFILAETIGYWFLKTHLTIPENRITAAIWVYHFSVLSFLMTILAIPYNSIIIAHEEMKIYSYISIAEVLFKLGSAFFLVIVPIDKLIFYSILLFMATTFVTLFYAIICRSKYVECKLMLSWDNKLFKELLSFSGWNLFGAVASVLSNQGINIILNIFFNPIINAARAIAFQINCVLNQFVMNFFNAVRPQITKYYAAGDNDEMVKLVFRSSKFSFFLLLFISMPVLLETNAILKIWLKDFPENTVLFTRLFIITALIETLTYPLMTAAQATGNIKKYQIVVGLILMSSLPISYLFLKLGYPPESVMYIIAIIAIISLFSRLYMLKNMICFPVTKYFSTIISKLVIVSALSFCPPALIILSINECFFRLFLTSFSSVLSSSVIIYIIGFTKQEQLFIVQLIKTKFFKLLLIFEKMGFSHNEYRR